MAGELARELVLRGMGIGHDRTITALKESLGVDQLEVVVLRDIEDFVEEVLVGRAQALLTQKPPEEAAPA